jgi:plastocyanin
MILQRVGGSKQVNESTVEKNMTGRATCTLIACVFAVGAAAEPAAQVSQARGGIIRGHIRLEGKPPGNPVIRMGMDPMCTKINAGKRVIQETVVASADGSLANVFVRLDGSFPPVPPAATPVEVNQKGCVYAPRVVGVQVGQTFQIRNSDNLLHNVHGLSGANNSFNIGQPVAGMVNKLPLKNPEVMLHVACDIHRWMNLYVGVVEHPYFAVSDTAGTFQIANVPPGTHTIKAWHERYGTLTAKVQVRAGATATADFSYTVTEKASGSP